MSRTNYIKIVSRGFTTAVAATCMFGSVVLAQRAPGLDSAATVQLLSNARGANPVMCELAMQSIDARYGNWGRTGRAPDAIIGQRTLLEWAANDIEDGGAVSVLGSALSDSDVCVSRMAARLFGRVRHSSALGILLRGLENRDDGTRRMSAVALGYLEYDEAVDPLMETLSDGVASVRSAATWALGEIEDERAVDALTQLLSDDPDPAVRRQAAWALGNMY